MSKRNKKRSARLGTVVNSRLLEKLDNKPTDSILNERIMRQITDNSNKYPTLTAIS